MLLDTVSVELLQYCTGNVVAAQRRGDGVACLDAACLQGINFQGANVLRKYEGHCRLIARTASCHVQPSHQGCDHSSICNPPTCNQGHHECFATLLTLKH